MRRITSLMTSATAALAIAAASLPARADLVTSDRTLTIADLNNPCTRGHDSIDGTLTLAGRAERTPDGNITLRLFARGSGTDVNNTGYRLLGVGVFVFHDPLPADILLRIRLTDPLNSSNNARLVLAVNVDERGRISTLGQTSLQCGTGTV